MDVMRVINIRNRHCSDIVPNVITMFPNGSSNLINISVLLKMGNGIGTWFWEAVAFWTVEENAYKSFIQSAVCLCSQRTCETWKESCFFTDGVTCGTSVSYVPDAPATRQYSIAAACCHNRLGLAVPLTLSDPCFPWLLPVLCDAHFLTPTHEHYYPEHCGLVLPSMQCPAQSHHGSDPLWDQILLLALPYFPSGLPGPTETLWTYHN